MCAHQPKPDRHAVVMVTTQQSLVEGPMWASPYGSAHIGPMSQQARVYIYMGYIWASQYGHCPYRTHMGPVIPSIWVMVPFSKEAMGSGLYPGYPIWACPYRTKIGQIRLQQTMIYGHVWTHISHLYVIWDAQCTTKFTRMWDSAPI